MKSKQNLEIKLIQKNEISYRQMYSLKILSMNLVELDEFLKSEEEENPFLELSDFEMPNINSYITYPENNSQYIEIENKIKTSRNWKEDIKLQINTEKLDKKEEEILDFFINSLNNRGFLEIDRKILKKKYNINNKKIEEIKNIIQNVEPIGIGSENLKEYFKYQLKYKKIKDKKIFKILDYYLEEIKNYRKVCENLKISIEELKKYYKLIKTLKMSPVDENEETQYIYPDISIKKINEEWEIEVEKDYSKIIKINEIYVNMLKNENEDEIKEYINEKVARIRLILECISKRENTLKQIVEIILEKQKKFFLNGEITPMSQTEIAKQLNKSESTISRAIKNKYVNSPKGLLELKSFFSTGYENTENKEEISSYEIKKYIKNIIENENEIIYSDSKIMNKVNEKFGIQISRRTITKYRNELNIPNKNIRELSR